MTMRNKPIPRKKKKNNNNNKQARHNGSTWPPLSVHKKTQKYKSLVYGRAWI